MLPCSPRHPPSPMARPPFQGGKSFHSDTPSLAILEHSLRAVLLGLDLPALGRFVALLLAPLRA